MALWAAGILLALGLVWFTGSLAVPAWQVRSAIREARPETEFYKPAYEPLVRRLGGPEAAARKLGVYVSLPEKLASEKAVAIRALGACGPRAVPRLEGVLLRGGDDARRDAACALRWIGRDAAGAIPSLEAAYGLCAESGTRAELAEAMEALGREPAGLRVRFKNLRYGRTMIVNKLEPGYDALRFEVAGADGRKRDCQVGVDWGIEPEKDLVSIPARGDMLLLVSLKHLGLAPGEYTAAATYRVEPDSYFVEQTLWHGPVKEWLPISGLWLGSARSGEVRFTVSSKGEVAAAGEPLVIELKGLSFDMRK